LFFVGLGQSPDIKSGLFVFWQRTITGIAAARSSRAVAAGNQWTPTAIEITRLLLCSHRTTENKRHMKINTSRKAGFTLVEIMIVVAIIGLLAAIAIPNFVRARNSSQANACINNLRQIDSATQQWAIETGAADSTAPSTAIYNYIKQGISLSTNCPSKGTYTLGASVTNAPTCSVAGHVLP
jgi:prepilin-type N-terminal cleavage/methylation domain-containing protein